VEIPLNRCPEQYTGKKYQPARGYEVCAAGMTKASDQLHLFLHLHPKMPPAVLMLRTAAEADCLIAALEKIRNCVWPGVPQAERVPDPHAPEAPP
jgi:hypothetical protein